jgi:tRNA(Ile)-lysidine synthase
MSGGAAGSSALLRALREALHGFSLRGERVLVAVSGGVDSSVLLHGLAALAPGHALSLAVGHVNHSLRGADSDADEAAVAALAERLALPFAARRVDPRELRAGGSSRTRPTLQEAARRLRREALGELARELGCTRLALAHTLDDQAETLLLRLFRGASPAGLAGIAPASADGTTIRPLLSVSRAEIERYARERGLSWREDASNRDPRYARGRLRTGGVAELAAALNPRWLRAVGELAEVQREESAWIEAIAERELARCTSVDAAGVHWLERAAFAELPDAIARRALRRLLRAAGGARDVSRARLERSLAFVRRARCGAALDLPGGLRWRAGAARCTLEQRGSAVDARC